MRDVNPGLAADPEPLELEELLIQALEAFEEGGAEGIENLLKRHPRESDRVRAHLDRALRLGLIGAGAEPSPPPERLGDFRLLEPLGQGSMGMVYRARQESLGREVALKLVRPEQLYFPAARERFQREVELVARLAHPGIVPVHSVGHAEGVPYFAMELVRGATLAEVLSALAGRAPHLLNGSDLDAAIAQHLGEPRDGPIPAIFRGRWCVVVVRILREVAEALEHAHRRGVLHRDVKPSNIMVTRAGRVLLMDFGLAGSHDQVRMTRTGSQLGSLAYMAPESLTDAENDLDARADVYALGVTGWELLTLRLPYFSKDPLRLHRLAAAAKRPRLVDLNSSVPWELEVVLATALEPDPERRYAGAAHMARDLDNVLAHRPIEAREAGRGLRLRRWSQRHPARATATAALLFALFVGPSLYAWQETRARRTIEAQRDRLAETNTELGIARERAQANFESLQLAVDTMLTQVGDGTLRDVPSMEKVRRELLTEALKFYEALRAQAPNDPALRLENARIHVRSAEVRGLLGDLAGAEQDLDDALSLFGQADAPAGTRDLWHARALTKLANVRRQRSRLTEALAGVDLALADWLALRAEAETDVVTQGLALARDERSQILAEQGDLVGALDESERLLIELDARTSASEWNESLDVLLASALDRSAVWLVQRVYADPRSTETSTRLASACERHRRAGELMDGLTVSASGSMRLRIAAAANRINLGIALQAAGDYEESLEVFRQGAEQYGALARAFPNSPRRRLEFAHALTTLATGLGVLDRWDEAQVEYARARELWNELATSALENSDFAIGLAQALQGEAVAVLQLERFDEVVELLVQSGAAADRALALRPKHPSYRRMRSKIYETLSEVELLRGRHVEAAEAARHLLDVEIAPNDPALVAALIARCAPLADADSGLDETHREALAESYREEALRGFENELAAGRTLAELRADPALANQWSTPGLDEVLERLE